MENDCVCECHKSGMTGALGPCAWCQRTVEEDETAIQVKNRWLCLECWATIEQAKTLFDQSDEQDDFFAHGNIN